MQSKIEVEVVCPFCNGRYFAGGRSKEEIPFVMHSNPACPKFLELEALDFLIAARHEMVRTGVLPKSALLDDDLIN